MVWECRNQCFASKPEGNLYCNLVLQGSCHIWDEAEKKCCLCCTPLYAVLISLSTLRTRIVLLSLQLWSFFFQNKFKPSFKNSFSLERRVKLNVVWQILQHSFPLLLPWVPCKCLSNNWFKTICFNFKNLLTSCVDGFIRNQSLFWPCLAWGLFLLVWLYSTQ